MTGKHWANFSVVLIIVPLIILSLILLPACGGGGEKDTPTFTNTSTPAPAPTGTPTTTQEGPVKIGAILPWSGPAAMAGIFFGDPVIKTVEKQVKDMGGILGGRSLQVVKYDDRGAVAEAAAGVTKLVLDNKVSALVFGGVGNSECNAVATAAAEYNILYVTNSPIDTSLFSTTVGATVPTRSIIDDTGKFITDVLKPKTVAMLGRNGEYDTKYTFPGWKKIMDDSGINIVYSEFAPYSNQDFTPYLTRIKYYDPDVLILECGSEEAITIAKQILGLGGWGHTQVVAQATALAAVKMAGAVGWLVNVPWYPGVDTPASIKFQEDFKTVNGRSPEIDHVFFYFCLWTAIHAIELAGTAEDTEAIALAARSGNLEYDSPVGHVHYTTDGDSGASGIFIQIQEGGKVITYNKQ